METFINNLYILGDGIFDRLTSQESVKFAWEGILSSKERNKLPTNHTLVGDGAENLLKQALLYKSFDNLTVVLVLLRPLEEIIAKWYWNILLVYQSFHIYGATIFLI